MERKPACSSDANSDARRGERAGRTKYMEKDLTSGSVLKNIFTFSLPYLLSYFLQTLYGMADLFIIGRFEGVASTTAVSIGSQVMHMITVMLVGVAMGTTVCIGRSVGAGDKKQAAKVIGNTVTLFMVGSVVLAAALVGLVDPIVRLISTPEEAVAGTAAYLTICFIGIPCITAYNVLASIFRGMGDSRSPMYFIAAACVVNIGLDFFFMGALRLGPAGAALGTTLSQAVSVLLALCVILKRKSIRLSKSDFCPRKATMKDILSIGLPVAAQDGFIQVSFMLITIMANQRGLTDAAAVGIVEKIISFLFLVPSSMLSTVSALGAQNIGAGKYDRVDDILRYAIAIGVGFGAVMALLMQFIAPSVVRPFLRRGGGESRCGLHPQLHLRLPVRGHPVQLQRLFLRLGQVGAVVSAQHPLHPAGACAGRMAGLPVLPPDPRADGSCPGLRLAVLQHRLRPALPLDEEAE